MVDRGVSIVGIVFLFGLAALVWLLWSILSGTESRRGGRGLQSAAAAAGIVLLSLLLARVGFRAIPVRLTAPFHLGDSGRILLVIAVVVAVLGGRGAFRSSAPRDVRSILIRRGIVVALIGLALGLAINVIMPHPPVKLEYAVLALIGLGSAAALRASLTTPVDADGRETHPASADHQGPG